MTKRRRNRGKNKKLNRNNLVLLDNIKRPNRPDDQISEDIGDLTDAIHAAGGGLKAHERLEIIFNCIDSDYLVEVEGLNRPSWSPVENILIFKDEGYWVVTIYHMDTTPAWFGVNLQGGIECLYMNGEYVTLISFATSFIDFYLKMIRDELEYHHQIERYGEIVGANDVTVNQPSSDFVCKVPMPPQG